MNKKHQYSWCGFLFSNNHYFLHTFYFLCCKFMNLIQGHQVRNEQKALHKSISLRFSLLAVFWCWAHLILVMSLQTVPTSEHRPCPFPSSLLLSMSVCNICLSAKCLLWYLILFDERALVSVLPISVWQQQTVDWTGSLATVVICSWQYVLCPWLELQGSFFRLWYCLNCLNV